MERKCKVTYLKHSSFLLETEHSYLLFDYWKGDLPSLNYEKTLYVFASHSHHDHYSKDIYKLENRCKEVYYILSYDIKEEDSSWKMAEEVHFMKEYEKESIKGCLVETLKSTDLGVAFIINVDGLSIYHAGDLHWWEWPGEPEEENEAYIAAYQAEIKRISGREFHMAFVVLDPRQDHVGGKGMDLFLAEVGARYVFPMHLWNDYDLIQRYKKDNQLKYVTSQIMDIRKPGDQFELIFS